MASPSASQPPAVTVDDLSDPTALKAGIELLDQDAVQLQSMPLKARRVIVRLESAAIAYYATNLRIRTRTRVRKEMLAYVVFGPQASGTVNGLPVRPGLMLAVEPETEITFVANGGWESISFLLPPADVLDHLTARQREGEFHLPQGVESLQVDAERVRALFEWGKLLLNSASKHPDLFDEQPRQRIAARDEMLEMVLATLRLADDFESTRSDRTRQAQSAIVKAVEDYAMAHTGDRLYVTDLCKFASVSERTLENVFKEVLGLTPMTYLARLRLHRVREALLAANPGSSTVSTEALNWGFWHFGEFSRAYKQCFGELPSDTLRRKP